MAGEANKLQGGHQDGNRMRGNINMKEGRQSTHIEDKMTSDGTQRQSQRAINSNINQQQAFQNCPTALWRGNSLCPRACDRHPELETAQLDN